MHEVFRDDIFNYSLVLMFQETNCYEIMEMISFVLQL